MAPMSRGEGNTQAGTRDPLEASAVPAGKHKAFRIGVEQQQPEDSAVQEGRCPGQSFSSGVRNSPGGFPEQPDYREVKPTSLAAEYKPSSPGPERRNVSFSRDSLASTAYEAHNPPAVLRKAANAATSVSSIALPNPKSERSAAPVEVPGQLASESAAKKKSRLQREPADRKQELHILLAVTGSVATIKAAHIIHKLKQIYHNRAVIQIIATKNSQAFLDRKEIPRDVRVWLDEDDWRSCRNAPDQTVHIRLRRWADILLVAPCSANTLAKFAYGICDNLLTSVFRVWNPNLPMLLAPAMNTFMYTNPVTKRHLNILKESSPFVTILRPVEKVLVCGDIGMGGMREWTEIVQIVVQRLGVPSIEKDEDSDESDGAQ